MSDLKPCPFCGGEALKLPSVKVTCKDFCRSFHNRTIPESDWNTRAEIQFNGDTVTMPKEAHDLLVARLKELENT